MKSAEEAKNICHNILYAFEAAERINRAAIRREWLNFVIAGAGATVVKLAGAIAEIVRRTLKDNFRSIHPEEAQIVRSVSTKAISSAKWTRFRRISAVSGNSSKPRLPRSRSQRPRMGTPGVNSAPVSDLIAGGRRISAPDEARAESVRLTTQGARPTY